MSKTAEVMALAHYKPIVGKTIVSVRCLNPAEMTAMGWQYGSGIPIEILLSDGTVVIPSSDPEGNDSGHLIIIAEEGDK